MDGSRLHFEECGSGPRALLLMHDGVVNSAIWDDVWPILCKQLHVIRYDRRGYGHSTATTKPYFEADDVAATGWLFVRSRLLGDSSPENFTSHSAPK